MKLVLMSSDGSSGELILISSRSFADRDGAFAELRRALSSGEADVSCDLYLLDLDAAAPIVIMVAPVEAETVSLETQVEPVEETFAAAVLEVAADEPPAAEVAPVVAETGQEPPSAGMPEEAEEPGSWMLGAVEPVEETSVAEEYRVDTAAPVVEETPSAEAAPVPMVVEHHAELSAVGESEAAAETAPETPLAESQAPAGAAPEALVAEDAAAVVPVTPLQWPWETGEEAVGEAAPAQDAGEPSVADAAEAPLGVMDPLGVSAAAATVAGGAGPQEPADDRGYEPGVLNLNEYTCDDCVYVNTCPNQHQKAPAACGSFQWKSV
jgi:hypothetical protein